MATRMQQRRGTAAQWTAANPILAAGEIGFETDTSKFKMGNGSSTWTALQYFANASELAAIIGDGAMPALLNSLDELAQAIGDDPQFYLTVGQNLTNHQNDSTMVHGIADTSLLATTGDVNTAATGAAVALAAHEADTTLVHGIADTALLATTADVQAAATSAASALSTHASDTTDVHGIADTSVLATVTAVSTAKSEAIADAADAADSKIATHNSDTTDVHGIGDTSLLATTADISTHNLDTTDVHGIADTSLLVTQQQLTDAVAGAVVDQSALAGVGIDWNQTSEAFDIDSTVATKTYADDAVDAHNDLTQNVHGIADTAALATKSYADTAEADAITAAGTAADSKVAAAVAALTKSSVGLANVDNTADSAKPVSTAQATAIATAKSEAIADATSQVNALLAGAPAALNTLDELAAALGDDANFASTVTTNLAAKAPLASPTFTGTVTVAASGIAFTDGTQTKEGTPSRTPIVSKTAAYTLGALTERDSLIEVSHTGASAVSVTIPADSTLNFPIGTSIDVLQTNTGAVAIAAGAGVTVNATPGLTLRTQWSSATLFKRAANTWVVYGDLK